MIGFSLIKPDGQIVAKEIIERIKDAELKIIYKKTYKPTKETVKNHWEMKTYSSRGAPLSYLIRYLCSGKVTAMVVEGQNVSLKLKLIRGFDTDPTKCGKDSIRGQYGRDSIIKSRREKRATYNLMHTADAKDALKEIKIWLSKYEKDNY